MAASKASKEVIWFRNILLDLDVVPNLPRQIMIYCDNTSVVANTKEPRAYKAAKHIERKYHLIQQFVKRGHIIVVDIASKDNRADPFTKSLPAKAFQEHVEAIRVRYLVT